MKKCPFCAESIQDEAIKCRFCGEMLPETPRAAAAPSAPPQWEPQEWTPVKSKGTPPAVVLGICGAILVFGLSIFHTLRVNNDPTASRPAEAYVPPAVNAPDDPPRPQAKAETAATESSANATDTGKNPAQRLAALDAGHAVDEGDPLVKQFDAALNALDSKADTEGNGKNGIARLLIYAQSEMQKKGVYESLLDLAHHLDDSIPADAPRLKLTETTALYMALRTSK